MDRRRVPSMHNPGRLRLGVILGIRVARSAPNRTLIEGLMKPALELLDFPSRKRKKTR
jgi:hypothetical protein